MKDLVVLTACKDAEHALRGLLSRPRALGIRGVDSDYRTHPHKDPGCLKSPESILTAQAQRYRFALVIFDREGSGAQAPDFDGILSNSVEQRLAAAGWGDRARCVMIEPELEQWVWSDSAQVDAVLGWTARQPPLRDWLAMRGFEFAPNGKPRRPKEAMQAAVREVRLPWSSGLFTELAKKVSVERCEDRAFHLLLGILRGWFPPT